jgi:hypothetical protein
MTFPIGPFNPPAFTKSMSMLGQGVSEGARYVGHSVLSGGSNAIELLRHIPDKFSHPKREKAAIESREAAKESVVRQIMKHGGRFASSLFSSRESNLSMARTTSSSSTPSQAIDDRTFDEKRTQLQSVLPAGVQVKENGVIAGTVRFTSFNDNPGLADKAGRSFKSALETDANRLGEDRLVAVGPSQTKISAQAKADFYRMDLRIGGKSIQEECVDKQIEGEERGVVAVNRLRDLCGSDENVTKISKVVTQSLSRLFIEGFVDRNGNSLALALDQGKNGEKAFRTPDGDVTNVKAKGIGGMQVSIDRNSDGNFEVRANWDMYFKGPGRAQEHREFSGMEDSLIRGQGTCTFTIDAQGPDVAFLQEPVVEVAFSGRMAGAPENVQ